MDDRAGGRRAGGLAGAVRAIVASEGVAGLYRGVAPNTVTAGSAWGSYFLFYQHIKSRQQVCCRVSRSEDLFFSYAYCKLIRRKKLVYIELK